MQAFKPFLLRVIAGAGLLAAPCLPASVVSQLLFDAAAKQYDARPEEASASFIFSITNAWTNEITIDRVQTSCGCTVASLPSNPWHIAPGGHGEVSATVNLAGKPAGLLSKTLTFYLSTNSVYAGTRVATVKVLIPAPPALPPLSAAARKAAMESAKADPQQIFKDPSCAQCHVNKGRNLWGSALYAADCGICHDSPNRDSSVPDLRALKTPTGFEYWKAIITHGKSHTLMPAFATSEGGPLNDDQVHSVAEYLDRTLGPKN